jgi:hypothetical protein
VTDGNVTLGRNENEITYSTAPDVLAQENVDDLETPLEQFSAVVEGLRE